MTTLPERTPPTPPLALEAQAALPAGHGAGAGLLAAAIRRHAQQALIGLDLAEDGPDTPRHTCDIGCADAIKADMLASPDLDSVQP